MVSAFQSYSILNRSRITLLFYIDDLKLLWMRMVFDKFISEVNLINSVFQSIVLRFLLDLVRQYYNI